MEAKGYRDDCQHSGAKETKEEPAQSKNDDDFSEHSQLHPEISISSLSIFPDEPAPFSSALDLTITFTLTTPLNGAHWEITYLVDSMRNRHIINMGKTNVEDYDAGTEHEMFFTVDEINIDSSIKAGDLTNSGLLSATLKTKKEEDVSSINMVVMVSKNDDGVLERVIYNPL
jgi:hypothetical protein